ncbi:MAG: MBL fold metallo-hydrolase [Bacteroidota bacterium]
MRFGGNTSCIEICIPGMDELLVLDCGTGFRNLGNALHAQNEKVHKGRIFITHPHWDHLQGFPFFKPFYDSENWFRILMPPVPGVECTDILKGHMSNTFFPVTIDMLEADIDCDTFEKGTLNFDHYSIEYAWGNHTIETAMFKIHVNGKTIVFAPDNEIPLHDSEESRAFISSFRSFIHGVDVLIHDAQFNMTQHMERQGWGHSCWETIIPMAIEENVKTLALTHHDPDSDDAYLSQLDEQVKAQYGDHFNALFFAREGTELSDF